MKIISHISYAEVDTIKEVVIVQNFDYENAKALKKYKHAMIFTETDFREGADVFPIDLYMMQKSYTIIEGKDILQDIKLKKKDLRHHLEFNLRSNRIYLKSQFLGVGAKKLVKTLYPTLHDNFIVAEEIFGLDKAFLDDLQSYKGKDPVMLIQQTDKAITKIIKSIN